MPRGSLARSDGWQVSPSYDGEAAPRQQVVYYCASQHQTALTFATDALLPSEWRCITCGDPAGLDSTNPPGKPVIEVFKTHFDYVRERRTPADAQALLDEALVRARKANR